MKILFIVMFFLLSFNISCQKKTDVSPADSKKILKIGTDATYPPFETVDVNLNKLVGFDIDLVKKICFEMRYEPEFLVVPFDGIIAGLKQKKYNLIISAMTITKEREREINFSTPYYMAGQSIVVRFNEKKIKGRKNLAGKKIGVQLGTTGELSAKKIKDTIVVSYDNITSAFIDLENSRIDAVINDIPTNKAFLKNRKDTFKIVGKMFTNEYYGIALRKEDTELLKKINTVLTKIKKNGYLIKLIKKWSLE